MILSKIDNVYEYIVDPANRLYANYYDIHVERLVNKQLTDVEKELDQFEISFCENELVKINQDAFIDIAQQLELYSRKCGDSVLPFIQESYKKIAELETRYKELLRIKAAYSCALDKLGPFNVNNYEIPREIFIIIALHNGVKELGSLCTVSKMHAALCNHDYIWKPLCLAKAANITNTDNIPWKIIYREEVDFLGPLLSLKYYSGSFELLNIVPINCNLYVNTEHKALTGKRFKKMIQKQVDLISKVKIVTVLFYDQVDDKFNKMSDDVLLSSKNLRTPGHCQIILDKINEEPSDYKIKANAISRNQPKVKFL